MDFLSMPPELMNIVVNYMDHPCKFSLINIYCYKIFNEYVRCEYKKFKIRNNIPLENIHRRIPELPRYCKQGSLRGEKVSEGAREGGIGFAFFCHNRGCMTAPLRLVVTTDYEGMPGLPQAPLAWGTYPLQPWAWRQPSASRPQLRFVWPRPLWEGESLIR